MPYEDIPAFIARLRQRGALAAIALELCILTAARSGELLGMRWDEIDFQNAVWSLPAGRMKAGRPHRVPLSNCAIAMLRTLERSKRSEFVFASRAPCKPLSNMALHMVLRRMGVDVTVHGFRSSFRDWAGNETPSPREVVETALAHVVGDKAEQAYRRSDALEKRRQLMEAWASYCTAGSVPKVVPIRARRRTVPIKRKAKRKAVTVKRKAVTESEIVPKRVESLSLQRVPTLAEVDEMVRRGDERRALREKAHDAEVKPLAEWRASDEYKALAERWAAPYVADSKPENPGEPMRAFGQAWWSLPVAVAWVATRDRNFAEVSLDKSMGQLAVALAKYAVDVKGFKSAGLPYKNSHDAFLALRDVTAEGGVQAAGDPYRWIPERPPRQVCEPRRAIDPLEIVSAVCCDDHGSPDCLVPGVKRPHGSRFQNVCFLRKDVLARFPALQATLATARNESGAVEALSGYVTDLTTRDDAEAWLRKQDFHIGKRAFQQRVWPKAREAAGLPPAAPRGRKRQS